MVHVNIDEWWWLTWIGWHCYFYEWKLPKCQLHMQNWVTPKNKRTLSSLQDSEWPHNGWLSFQPRFYRGHLSICWKSKYKIIIWLSNCLVMNCMSIIHDGVATTSTFLIVMAFMNSVDVSFQICCLRKWFSTRFTFVIFMVFMLSLIHIWRCRRYSLCRSRWSPYH